MPGRFLPHHRQLVLSLAGAPAAPTIKLGCSRNQHPTCRSCRDFYVAEPPAGHLGWHGGSVDACIWVVDERRCSFSPRLHVKIKDETEAIVVTRA